MSPHCASMSRQDVCTVLQESFLDHVHSTAGDASEMTGVNTPMARLDSRIRPCMPCSQARSCLLLWCCQSRCQALLHQADTSDVSWEIRTVASACCMAEAKTGMLVCQHVDAIFDHASVHSA